MKLKCIVVVMTVFVIVSCKSKMKELTIMETSFHYIDSSSKPVDSFYQFDKANLEIELSKLGNGKGYFATKTLSESKNINNFFSVTIFIVDESKKKKNFTSSTEFLNYMTDYGYEMTDKKEGNYGPHYVFRRK